MILFASHLLLSACGCDEKSPSGRSNLAAGQPSQSQKPQQPLVKKVEIADWCPEHGVPESICTRCNTELIEGFKKKGDWCAKHGLPDSQCLDCHPELKAKFEAMKPKQG
jgi:hypothetical protein